jgi:hypothetical protein
MQNKGQPFQNRDAWGVTDSMSHCVSSIRISKSPLPLRRDVWSEIPPVSGDMEGTGRLSMVVRGYRLFLLNHITFWGTYVMIVLKRLL